MVNKQPPTPCRPPLGARRQAQRQTFLREKGGGWGALLIDRDLKETQLADGQMALLIKCWLAAEIWLASPFTGEWGSSIPLLTFWLTSEFLHLCVCLCARTHMRKLTFLFERLSNQTCLYNSSPMWTNRGGMFMRLGCLPSVSSHCLAKENGTLYNTICWPQAQGIQLLLMKTFKTNNVKQTQRQECPAD